MHELYEYVVQRNSGFCLVTTHLYTDQDETPYNYVSIRPLYRPCLRTVSSDTIAATAEFCENPLQAPPLNSIVVSAYNYDKTFCQSAVEKRNTLVHVRRPIVLSSAAPDY